MRLRAGSSETVGLGAANFPLLLIAAGAWSMAAQLWWLGPTLSACALAAVLWLNWGRQALRAYRLRKPAEAFLTTAPALGEQSWAKEIHLPANQQVMLQLRLKPRLTHVQHDLIFGFLGDEKTRPIPLEVRNEFIKEGKHREQSPSTNDNHYIDYNDCYHIKEKADRIVGNVYAIGFLVQTRAPGRYQIRLMFITDTGDGEPSEPLFLTVETRN